MAYAIGASESTKIECQYEIRINVCLKTYWKKKIYFLHDEHVLFLFRKQCKIK